MQTFYLDKKKDRLWSYAETQALDLYFLDNGRRRTFAPPEEWVWKTLGKWLLEHARVNPKTQRKKITTLEQGHKAAQRCLTEGLKRLKERARALAVEPPRPANNLAGLGLDDVVIELLLRNGFSSKPAVEKASDTALLAVHGINRARLRQIRHVCPHISAKTAKQRAALAAGQGSLF